MSPPASFPIIVCRGEDYRSASEGMGFIRDDASEVHSALLTTLAGYGGMGGSDTAGEQWAKSYDEAVDAALQTSSKLVSTCARTSDLIAAGAHNHAVAEAAANGVEPPPTPAVGFDPCLAIRVPSAGGGGGPEPFGWSLIKSVSGLVWPNGHQDQLRAAKDVWYAAAEALDTATGRFPNTVGLLENQQSAEIPAAVAACSETSYNFMELQAAYREIGDSCADYAQHLDDAHSEILDELKKMLIETAAVEAGMAVLVPFTGGLSELGNGAVIARIGVYAARIGRIIDRLVTKVAAIASRIGSAVTGKLKPILTKLGEWLEKAKTKWWRSDSGGGLPELPPKPAAVKPTVNDRKLQNFLDDLYKGANNPDRVGDGTTADAVRNEFRNLVPTEGKWHLQKAMEVQRGLANWLMNKANTDPADRAVAIRELTNLMDALAGK
ncbi:hypothetical protein NBRGN_057_03120 [Nocardia brasiliensis NBRC 14402]|nr:hypothetical protein [Nocardia brasiliensis]GAJ82805.1 hypothetical protein NBRGN_057_03120 [Nocardia brasiliensis NBRC 14402]SUB09498.1 Uncharacterised protein [Nocardia brasiliensis]